MLRRAAAAAFRALGPDLRALPAAPSAAATSATPNAALITFVRRCYSVGSHPHPARSFGGQRGDQLSTHRHFSAFGGQKGERRLFDVRWRDEYATLGDCAEETKSHMQEEDQRLRKSSTFTRPLRKQVFDELLANRRLFHKVRAAAAAPRLRCGPFSGRPSAGALRSRLPRSGGSEHARDACMQPSPA